MRRTALIFYTVSLLVFVAGLPVAGYAAWDDSDICPGTGAECVVRDRKVVGAVDGVVDLTHPLGVPPLTLHIVSGGALVANTNPLTPLVIKAGAIIVDSGGAIVSDVFATNGNPLTLIAIDTAPPQGANAVVDIRGTVESSALRLNGSGGDGGSVSVTSAGSCRIQGKVAAIGSASTSVGGNGGDIGFDCTTITVDRGALLDTSGTGMGGAGGTISLTSEIDGLVLVKGSTLRALGSGFDAGSVSLASNSVDPNATCAIASKILLDAKTLATPFGPMPGTGGNVDISCGGNISIQKGATFNLSGGEGGGGVDAFCGGDLTMESGTTIKANAVGSTGGSVDLAAGNNIRIAGKIQTRSGGLSADNDGAISVTSTGDLVIAKGALLDTSAGRSDFQAGQITLASGDGDGITSPLFTIEAGTALRDNGHTAGFGSLDVDISGSTCRIGGQLLSAAKADNGVSIGLVCDNVTFDSTSRVQATAKGGAGGVLSIDTTAEFGGTPGNCTLGGKFVLTGSAGPGLNGSVASGRGGSLGVNCGAALSAPDRSLIDVSSGGSQGVGGQVTLSSTAAMHIGGSIHAKATGALSGGGRVALGAPDVFFDALPGTIDVGAQVAGTIEASATGGPGGSGMIQVQKALSAKGSALGGSVVVSGCSVEIPTTGWLRADGSTVVGSGGVNEVRARNQLSVLGKMTAMNGSNNLLVNAGMAEASLSTVKPLPLWDHSLTSCP